MTTPVRARRPPPPFVPVSVASTTRLTPRLVRVTLTGEGLCGLGPPEPAASVRLYVPSPTSSEPVLPEWHGNEFLLPDGSRPAIRTLTPRRFAPPDLDVWIVLHGGGAASDWAAGVQPGAPAAVSGFGRGYPVPADAAAFLVVGDETAAAAVAQLLEVLPAHATVTVHLEVAHPSARFDLGSHPGATITWHLAEPGAPPGDALVRAVEQARIRRDTYVWAAGEAAAMQRIRRHLFDDRGIEWARTWVRGYWKHGRAGDAGAAEA